MTKPDEYVSDIQLAARYGLKARESIWKWVKTQNFPKPINLSPGCTRWRMSEVETWEKSREIAA
ncbi:AlpA family phage regulatory protein [Sinirhodobacter populi]|uniref:AlpA family phage regulatory protein n=1 Tax=Paenirhodobacter populi TaxID=2306993 RepID=A0A443JUQ3_9RHOB|nr:AlpA family phage regulatory protein [Sinirhodobacter populi]RWR24240.1 AlpA family phage regulatory protein [Sinirhodobacter populi]